MKRTFFLLLCCLVLSLSACGVPQTDYDALVEENSSLQAQVESLQSDDEIQNPEQNLSTEETPDEFFSKVAQEYEETSSSSLRITSGDFYDSVSAVHPEIALIESGSDISISIFLKPGNESENSAMFFDVANKIMETSELENYYSGVTFMMYVDNSFVAMLTLIDYSSSSSFTSTGPIVIKDEYKEPIETLYSTIFSSSDASTNFDKSLDELREKYNLSN